MPSTRPLVLGHRGLSSRRLENSMEAFRAALAAGIRDCQGAIIIPWCPKNRRSWRVTAVIPVHGVNSVSQRSR